MEIALNILQSLILLAIAVWYVLFASYKVKAFVEETLLHIQAFIFWAINAIYISINASVHTLHWVGRFFVILIFLGAGITLIDNISIILEFEFLSKEGVIFRLTRLFDNKTTWIASTAIVATTVALGHFKTLDFNYQKHQEEQREKIIEKRKNNNENT